MNTENETASGIHATAVVSPQAHIGKNVQIGPYAVIEDHVSIGDGTIIGAHAVIHEWTTIGENCHIFQCASVGEVPQDLKFKGEKSTTVIGDRTSIREFATIHRATGEGEETRIGNDCLLMAYTHVAHNCVVGNNVIMSNAAMIAGHVVVEDRVVIGGMTGVHQFVKIGRNAMVGGASKLVQDVVPYTIVDGRPAKAVGLNTVGISRAEGIASRLFTFIAPPDSPRIVTFPGSPPKEAMLSLTHSRASTRSCIPTEPEVS